MISRSDNSRLPPLLFIVSIVWLALAIGNVTYFRDTWKFVPAFFFFSVSVILRPARVLLFHQNRAFIILAGAHFFFTIFPSVFWSKGYDILYLICVNLALFSVAIFSQAVLKKSVLKTLAYAMVCVLILSSVIGIFEHFGLLLLNYNTRSEAISVSFNNPNIYGGFLIAAIALAGAAFVLSDSRAWQAASVLAVALGCVNVLLTQSRAVLLGLAVGLLFFGISTFFTQRPTKKTLRRSILILSGILLMCFVFLFLSRSFFVKLLYTQRAFAYRFVAYRIATKLWLLSPVTALFGNGLGSFKPLFFTHKPPDYRLLARPLGWDAVHNEYLELFVDGGILSFLVFMALIVYLFRLNHRTQRANNVPQWRKFSSRFAMAAILAFLVDGLLSTNLRVPVLEVLFYLCVGIVVSTSAVVPKSTSKTSVSVTIISSLVLLVILLPLNFIFVRRLITDNYHARSFDTRNDTEGQIDLLKSGIALEPHNINLSYELSLRYLRSAEFGSFYPISESIEKIIHNYNNNRYLRGLALSAEKKYVEAIKQLNSYLLIDPYDQDARMAAIVAEALSGDLITSVNSLKTLFQNDFLLRSIQNETELQFPKDLSIVQRQQNTDAADILKIGEINLRGIIDAVIVDEPWIFDLYALRIHHYLGKIYGALSYPNLALYHFHESAAYFRYLKQIGESSGQDATLLQETGVLLRELLEHQLILAREEGDRTRETTLLTIYTTYFSDKSKLDRNLTLFRQMGRYKQYRRLKR